VLESTRLTLSPYTDADLDSLFAIHSDSRVGQFTYSPTRRAEAAERYESAEAQRRVFGAAPWVGRNREAELVGYGGLLIDTFDPGWGVEIAYFVAPEFWGRGYASEMAHTAVRFGFETLGLDRMVSFAHPENAASARVLAKVGMQFAEYLAEMDRNRYVMRPRPVLIGGSFPGRPRASRREVDRPAISRSRPRARTRASGSSDRVPRRSRVRQF
jgi:ribosomal-protein-alanine N-acetyltransferase